LVSRASILARFPRWAGGTGWPLGSGVARGTVSPGLSGFSRETLGTRLSIPTRLARDVGRGLGRATGRTRGSIATRLARGTGGTLRTGATRLTIVAGAARWTRAARGTGLTGDTGGTRGARRAGAAWRGLRLLANGWWATGEAGDARHAGDTGLPVPTRGSGRAREPRQTAASASSLTLGDGVVAG